MLDLFMQETVAEELEESYRSHVWDPSLRHVQKQKQGVTAARVELTTLFTKVVPQTHVLTLTHSHQLQLITFLAGYVCLSFAQGSCCPHASFASA